MKKLIALLLSIPLLFVSPLRAASNLAFSATIAADGVTATMPIANCVTAISPTSNITGFTFHDIQGASNISANFTFISQTASGCTVTIILSSPVRRPADDTVTFDLTTAGGGSNMTDGAGNTPSGQSGVSVTNDSEYYAPGSAFFASASQPQGAIITNPSGLGPNSMQCNSSDCFLEFNATATQINVSVFRYGIGSGALAGSHFILQQLISGTWTDIQDWGTNSGATTFGAQSLVTGLSGAQSYRIIAVNSSGVPFQDTIINAVRVTGTLGAQPAARLICGEAGPSEAGLFGGAAMSDSRLGHMWLACDALGMVDQHIGTSGTKWTGGGGIATTAATWMSDLGGAPQVVFLRGGYNDLAASVSPITYAAAYASGISALQGIASPPAHIVCLTNEAITGQDFTAYNAALAVQCPLSGAVYVDPTLWAPGNSGFQVDGLHFAYGAPRTDATKNENLYGNRIGPIVSGYAFGSSYTLNGPSTGTAGSASTDFTVALPALFTFACDSDSVCRQTLTLSDGGQGGTFTPSIGSPGVSPINVTPISGNSFTFTYTAASSGAKTITVTTAIPAWTAPSGITFTAAPSGSVGQSIQIINTGTVSNSSVPAVSTATGKCRIDFGVHDFSTSFSADIITANFCGPVHILFIVYPPGSCAPHADPCNAIEIYNGAYDRTAGFPVSGCPGVGAFLGELWPFAAVGGHTITHVRYMNDFATHIDSMETWNGNGAIQQTGHTNQCTWTNLSGTMPSNGVVIGDTAAGGDAYALGYVHIYNDNLPLGSRMPTFAESKTHCVGYYQFNTDTGNLTDTCTSGPYNLTSAGVAPTYADTPTAIQSVVVANPRTNDAPAWSNWFSLRAGIGNTLDCTNSVSMSESSDVVSCLWSHVSGPTVPTYSSLSVTKPVLTNIARGTYLEHVVVTDVNSNTASADLNPGAVQCDSRGRVITGDSNIDAIYSPMLCFGSNPYHWKDNRQWATIQAQRTFISTNLPPFQQWQTSGAGTIAYKFTGIGPAPGTGGTTLSSTCNATDATCAVTDASQLPGLADLPTWLLIGNVFGQAQELVRVTATTATSGTATITFGYDGRGLPPLISLTTLLEPLLGPSTWPAGTTIGESRVVGTSTQFVSDSGAAICPAGAPGPPGAVVYSTGTVTIAASTNTVTGSGTTFTSAMVGDSIRISAAHASGTPFVTWASITAFTDATHLTTNHTWPVGVDGTAFTYKIVTPRYMSLEFVDPTGVTQRGLQSTLGCESETKAYFWSSHDITGVNGTSISGLKYAAQDAIGINSQFSLNFYGGSAAERSFCYQSGYCHLADNTGPLDLADAIDDNNAGSPENCGGYCGGTPLYFGGGAYGSTIKAAISPGTWAKWDNITGWFNAAYLATQDCNAWDSRDGSILAIPQMMSAVLDTNPTRKAASIVAATSLLAREQGCARSNFSFAHNSEYFNVVGNTPPITLTLGSATGTMTSGTVPAGYCYGTATVTITVTHNSATFTGNGIVDGDSMIINGTINSGAAIYTPYVAYTHSGSTSGVLALLWPGDSGTVTAVIQSGTQTPTAFYRSAADDMAKEAWACTQASSTTITLNRPWDGPTHTDYLNAHSNVRPEPGNHQQTFMVGGWKGDEFRFGAQIIGAVGVGFKALITGVANWIMTIGADPNTRGMNYTREFGSYLDNPNGAVTGGCEPSTVQSGPVIVRSPSCDQPAPLPGTVAGSIDSARTLNAEAGLMLAEAFRINPSNSALAKFIEDFVYGPLWGNPTMTDAGHYTDTSYVNDSGGLALTGGTCNLSTCKYNGFFFGHNFANWPAFDLDSRTRVRGGRGNRSAK